MNFMGHNFQAVASNWIAVSRDVRDHHLVGFGQPVKAANPKKGAFSRAEAWLDLIMLARWKDGPETNKGRRFEMLAGQLQGGYSFLADRWNWTVQTVRTFLGKLIDEHMLERAEPQNGQNLPQKKHEKNNKQNNNQIQVLTVCNYKRYQLMNELMELQDQQANNKRATSEQQHLNKDTLIQEDISPIGDSSPAVQGDLLGAPQAEPKVKRKSKTAPEAYTDDFEEFWKLYPRKEGKGDAFRLWQRHPMPEKRRIYARLRDHLPGLLAKKNDPGGNFCAMPATWLFQKRYDDEVEQPKAQVNGFNGHASFEERRAESASNWLLSRPLPGKRPEPVLESEF